MKFGPVEVSKKLFITMIVVLTIGATIVKKIYVNRYERLKVNKNQDFIYTREEYKESKSYVPYINLNTSFAKELNSKIKELARTYEDSDTSNQSISYRYNVNANIVSVVIILKSINDKDELDFDFITYVFDLDNKGKALTDEEILSKYSLDEDNVRKTNERKI